jgi:hypothetical protein
MGRISRHRIGRIEEFLSVAAKKPERRGPMERCLARHHTTAVAAIVLSGQPRVDEPLIQAWARALRHYEIERTDQVAAAERLLPIVLGGEEESARFTEIFSTAPVWLLQFTGMAMDARFLKFHLPDISQTLTWGSHGFEDARRWPSLPLGTMTAGDRIQKTDPRQLWIILFCMLTIPIFPDFWDNNPQEEEDEINAYRRSDPLLDDIFFALDLDEKPEKAWSRYEKRRMRKLAERISRLNG